MVQNFLPQFIVLIAASIISLILVTLKTPAFLQMAIGALIVIFLIFFNRLLRKNLILIFLSSLFLQLLIFLTGGFYSQFLVVFHLFAITLSFLISLKIAVTFLIISTITLITGSVIDPRLAGLLTEDSWPAILYILSFIMLIPLYQLVISRYNLKETISEILARQIQLSKIREGHLMSSVSDLIFITDPQLMILSVNEVAAATLRLSPAEALGRPLLQILFLKDKNGSIADRKYLSIDEIINDKTVRTIDNLLLYTKNSFLPKNISLQIRPSLNLEKKVDQIMLVLSRNTGSWIKGVAHPYLQSALLKHEAAVTGFKNKLKNQKLNDLQTQIEILERSEKDLLTTAEIEDHGIEPKPVLLDISQVVYNLISSEQNFAKNLGVNVTLKLDERYLQDARRLIPPGTNFSPEALTSRYFTAPVDPKWFNLLVQKLVDINILLSAGEKNKQVAVNLSYGQDMVSLVISTTCSSVKDPNQLFSLNFGDLSLQTNLRLGSGLEGFLAKAIADLLNIKLNAKYDKNSLLTFKLELAKGSMPVA